MKKLIPLTLVMAGLLLASNPAFAAHFKCYRYVNGSPTGTWIRVEAASKSEAESRSMARFRELGGRVDSTNCHYD